MKDYLPYLHWAYGLLGDIHSKHCYEGNQQIVLLEDRMVTRDLLSVLRDGLSKVLFRTPLVVWWMESHLPMQGIQDQSLIHEGFTCCRQLKPMCHNYWACVQQWRTRATKKKKKKTLNKIKKSSLNWDKMMRKSEEPGISLCVGGTAYAKSQRYENVWYVSVTWKRPLWL